MGYGEPTAATKYTLFRLCRGRCYKPGCSQPVVKLVHGHAQTMAKVAHIYGRRPGSARYDPSISEKRLKGFDNLLLLCATHHDEVDGPVTRHRYTVELLQRWKHEREDLDARPAGALDEIDDTTLLSQMTAAVDNTRGEILQALTHLPLDLASILHTMVDEAFTRPYLDIDAIYSLYSAAHMLQNLSDDASRLHSAAARLEDAIDPLRQVADDVTNTTSQATTVAEWLATGKESDGSAWTSTINMAADRLQSTINTLLDFEPQPLQLDRENFWWAIRRGAAYGAVIATIITAVATAWITVQIMR